MLGFPKKKKIATKSTNKPKMLTSLEIDDKEEEFESERQETDDSYEPGLAVIVHHQESNENFATTAETTLRRKTFQEPQKWSCGEGDVAMCLGVFSKPSVRTTAPPTSCRCSPEKDLVVEDFE